MTKISTSETYSITPAAKPSDPARNRLLASLTCMSSCEEVTAEGDVSAYIQIPWGAT